jgi:cytochrome b subunit of formate dehydrogenase
MKLNRDIKAKIVVTSIIIILYFITGVALLVLFAHINKMSEIWLPYLILAISAITCIIAYNMLKKKPENKNGKGEHK